MSHVTVIMARCRVFITTVQWYNEGTIMPISTKPQTNASETICAMLVLDGRAHMVRIASQLLVLNVPSWIEHLSISIRYRALSAALAGDALQEIANEQVATELERWQDDPQAYPIHRWSEVSARLAVEPWIVDSTVLAEYIGSVIKLARPCTDLLAATDVICIVNADKHDILATPRCRHLTDHRGAGISCKMVSEAEMAGLAVEQMLTSMEQIVSCMRGRKRR